MQVSCLLTYLLNAGHAYNFENILVLSNSDSKNPQWYELFYNYRLQHSLHYS